ncbi:MAG: YceI family protein [Burkholderiales bacterium]
MKFVVISPRTVLTLALSGAAAVLLVGVAQPAWAQQALVPAQSEITFITKQMGVPVDGKFTQFDAQVAFDPKAPETAKIAFTIDMASATLGIPETDAELGKPDWFDSTKHPKATFRSTAIKPLGSGRYEVTGDLEIKAQRRAVTVPVMITQAAGNTTAAGSFSIKRLDYRIGEGDWKDTSMVADPVQIKFKLVLSGVPAM